MYCSNCQFLFDWKYSEDYERSNDVRSYPAQANWTHPRTWPTKQISLINSIFDSSYLRIQKSWTHASSEDFPFGFILVHSNGLISLTTHESKNDRIWKGQGIIYAAIFKATKQNFDLISIFFI